MKTTPIVLLALAGLVLSAGANLVPGGDFQLYKPGSTTVTATLTGGFVPWPASIPDPIDPTSLTVNGGTANYSDTTTGSTVDLLGWTKAEGGADFVTNGTEGSMALNLFAAWGGTSRPIVETTGSLHTIGAGDSITISTMVGGPTVGPKSGEFFFSLYAGEVEIIPSSVVDQSLPLDGGFQMISRTYDASALAAHIGQSTKIRIAIPSSNTIGNRIIFDDVTFEVVPGSASSLQLVITPDTTDEQYNFEWNSQANKVYDLVTSTDLATPIAEWPVYMPQGGGDPAMYADIPATGTSTTLTSVVSSDPQRFFAVVEKDAPPLFSEDFEISNGGFMLVGAPNDWAWGPPQSSNNFNLTVTSGNGGSSNAWGTNLGTGATPSGLINTSANSILQSPDIALTGVSGAKLSFAAAYDTANGDVVEVLVRESGSNDLLHTLSPITPPATQAWTSFGPFDLTEADNKTIYLQFRYQGTSAEYLGLYIDNVTLTR